MKVFLVLLLAVSTVNADNSDYGLALFQDIKSHVSDYLNLFVSGSQIEVPEVLGSFYQEIATYTDDSYSHVFSDFPVAEVTEAVQQLPWYEERLSSTLSKALAKNFNNSTMTSIMSEMKTTTSIQISMFPSFLGVPSWAYNKSRSTLDEASLTSSSLSVGEGFNFHKPPVYLVTLFSLALLFL